jgi:TRAP-type C4-dicarboxylate transport system permease small subunit
MKRIRALEQALSVVEQWLLTIALGTLLLLAFLQVVLREFFSAGLIWADIVNRHLVLWIGFLGGAVATKEERHLSIDFVRRTLSPRILNIVQIITELFAMLVCGLLTQSSLAFLIEEKSSHSMLISGIPLWYAETIIPAGFALIGVHMLIRLAIRSFSSETAREGT